jgi:hypothetical protein
MKQISLLTFFALYFTASFAQDCKDYFFLQNNKTIEMTIYNKKGNPNGKQVYKVSDVSTTGGVVTATLNSELFDKKGKSQAVGSSRIECNGGEMKVDMKMMLSQQQQEQFSKAEARFDKVYIEYPVSMKEGDQLTEGNFTMDMETGGLKQNLTMVISDRKVAGKESITTPAGTWDCFKITFNSRTVVKTAGIGIPIKFEGTEWYAPGFGIVKTASKYGGTEITAIQ